ncbi:MAG TPA: hypothetical protein VJR92_07645 [Gemmatimonadaceae bacterium]|nr:hypothetical protein [Gemmatimonadaceae bacterium]
MSLSALLPKCDARVAEHRVVNGSRAEVFGAAVANDLLLSSALRPAGSALRDQRGAVCARDLPEVGEWARLSEDFSREIVLGGIAKLRARDHRWIRTSGHDFERFNEPGHVRIACSISVTSIGDGRCVLSYEIRARATDTRSRKLFGWIWKAIAPFVSVTMRAMATQVERRLTLRTSRDLGLRYIPADVAPMVT